MKSSDPQLIDNKRFCLVDVLKMHVNSGDFKHLSVATGYWDLKAMAAIIDDLGKFESVRILIGQEPMPDRLQKKLNLFETDELFPDDNFSHDLENLECEKDELGTLRKTATRLRELIEQGVVEVKVFRKPRLHAKAYIFGNLESPRAVGIIGSSNFTYAGLNTNAELDYCEYDSQKVQYEPKNETQQNGHLTWFNELWNDKEAVPWTGDFKEILETAPVGDLTFSPYEAYIKTLMEVFPDEMVDTPKLIESEDVLHSFQNRNAGILIKKLERQKVAMLSDSVGLGKTITAGAVMKHYIERDNARIRVIVPAALMTQWEDDLEKVLGLESSRDFELLSMQNSNYIQKRTEDDRKYFRRNKHVDLFVIDEAHNLRSSSSTRRDAIEEMLEAHEDAKVLLLTATPVNNRLIDFGNQLQLGLKGKLTSVSVPYPNNRGEIESIDFMEALRRIETVRRREGEKFDWEKYRPTLDSGLRHYLVRSTRAGVEAEFPNDMAFPETKIESIDYSYSNENITFEFEGLKMRDLNVDIVENLTQLSKHPLNAYRDEKYVKSCLEEAKKANVLQRKTEEESSVIVELFKAICCLGLVPYRPDVYKHDVWGKTPKEIDETGVAKKNLRLKSELSIHNIVHISWLKRIESSTYALKKSIENYVSRLNAFEKWLNAGYVVTLKDLSALENDYDEDIESAFGDYDEYVNSLENSEDNNEAKEAGIKRVKADPQDFNIEQMKIDILRDKQICEEIIEKIRPIVEENPKLKAFEEFLEKQDGKVLVFSFFADTIKYLEKQLKNKLPYSAFISGQTKENEHKVQLFSPTSKNYELKDGETEIQYLFATDVLSEGQNLQDAGVLVNYDLHWNPVRMIQRNGRINRLGSKFPKVTVANCKPTDQLETYLNLVKRLEYKIENINQTIGLDQDVMKQGEANPIEFIENAQKASDMSSVLDDELSWTENFIADLRDFLKNSSDDEIKKIQKMPTGKWNYLPKTSNANNTLALHKIATGDRPSEQTSCMFFEISESEGANNSRAGSFVKAGHVVSAKFIQDGHALNMIKTDASDNERVRDNINVDRALYDERVCATAKTEAPEQGRSHEKLSDSERDAIVAISEYISDIDLQPIIESCLKTRRELATFKALVRRIKKDLREEGSLSVKVINDFSKFYSELKANAETEEEREISSQKTILFYVPAKG